jgi:hypothetical protein
MKNLKEKLFIYGSLFLPVPLWIITFLFERTSTTFLVLIILSILASIWSLLGWIVFLYSNFWSFWNSSRGKLIIIFIVAGILVGLLTFLLIYDQSAKLYYSWSALGTFGAILYYLIKDYRS